MGGGRSSLVLRLLLLLVVLVLLVLLDLVVLILPLLFTILLLPPFPSLLPLIPHPPQSCLERRLMWAVGTVKDRIDFLLEGQGPQAPPPPGVRLPLPPKKRPMRQKRPAPDAHSTISTSTKLKFFSFDPRVPACFDGFICWAQAEDH